MLKSEHQKSKCFQLIFLNVRFFDQIYLLENDQQPLLKVNGHKLIGLLNFRMRNAMQIHQFRKIYLYLHFLDFLIFLLNIYKHQISEPTDHMIYIMTSFYIYIFIFLLQFAGTLFIQCFLPFVRYYITTICYIIQSL